jgi:hypothetical protein
VVGTGTPAPYSVCVCGGGVMFQVRKPAEMPKILRGFLQSLQKIVIVLYHKIGHDRSVLHHFHFFIHNCVLPFDAVRTTHAAENAPLSNKSVNYLAFRHYGKFAWFASGRRELWKTRVNANAIIKNVTPVRSGVLKAINMKSAVFSEVTTGRMVMFTDVSEEHTETLDSEAWGL